VAVVFNFTRILRMSLLLFYKEWSP